MFLFLIFLYIPHQDVKSFSLVDIYKSISMLYKVKCGFRLHDFQQSIIGYLLDKLDCHTIH